MKRGVYRITQAGSELLATGITSIDKDVLRRYPNFVEFIDKSDSKHAGKVDPGKGRGSKPKPSGNDHEPADAESPKETIESSMALIRQKLADESSTPSRSSPRRSSRRWSSTCCAPWATATCSPTRPP